MEKKEMLMSTYYRESSFDICRRLGFTLFQTDSDHISINELPDGSWDWSAYDECCESVLAAGMKWLFFPHFAFPPPWYRQNVEFTRMSCLEHGETVEAFSLFEPQALDYLERGYKALAERYGDKISGFYLGVHGDYGECMYPANCRTSSPGQREDWEQRFGNLHNHYGYWCGDKLARENFSQTMLARYGSLDGLNLKWGTDYKNESDISYPLIPPQWDKNDDGSDYKNGLPPYISRIHWLDFTRWYLDIMTDYSREVAQAANRYFPKAVKMFPLGAGDEDARVGQDNSGLVKMAKEEGVSIRSTHGGCYDFPTNASSMLARIATACKHYGVDFLSEPPSGIAPDRLVSRLFETICCGSVGIWDWDSNPVNEENQKIYAEYRDLLVIDKPVVRAALLFPQTYHYLHPEEGFPYFFRDMGIKIRGFAHFDILDERLITDGALENYDYLIHLQGDVFERSAVQEIKKWVRDGGVFCSFIPGDLSYADGGQFDFAFSGHVISNDGTEGAKERFYAMLNDILFDSPVCGKEPLDYIYRTVPGVYGVLLESGSRLLYNSNSESVTVNLPGGSREMQAHSIISV
jgi:hypothetical protein